MRPLSQKLKNSSTRSVQRTAFDYLEARYNLENEKKQRELEELFKTRTSTVLFLVCI